MPAPLVEVLARHLAAVGLTGADSWAMVFTSPAVPLVPLQRTLALLSEPNCQFPQGM
jgi:hypothetical protein